MTSANLVARAGQDRARPICDGPAHGWAHATRDTQDTQDIDDRLPFTAEENH
ncbi:hypothetical protein [Streptomyces lincolnensis]|uniref:hypothetical protein n=1 Tax=Streptomyces lincolnensis TaxID=1915 RepID=UPI0037D08C60